jgi:hypothetical protein
MANPITTKNFNPKPQTLSSTRDSITISPYNSRSVHEVCRCSQGRPSLEEKTAKTVSFARFSL